MKINSTIEYPLKQHGLSKTAEHYLSAAILGFIAALIVIAVTA